MPEDTAPTPTPAATPAATAPVTPAAAAPTTPAPETETDWKAEARKWEQRAKDNKTKLDEAAPKLTEYDRLVAASKTDLERAQDAATTAAAQVQAANQRAVKAEVKALAAPDFADAEDAAAFLATGTYLTADGDVDTARIRTDLADLLARKPHLAKPQGTRVPAPNPAQGSSASGAPDLEAQIAQAQKSGDVALQVRLQNQKLLAPLKQ